MQLSLRKALVIAVFGSFPLMAQSQQGHCDDIDEETLLTNVFASLGVSIFAPMGLAGVFIVCLSLPLCCGVMKDKLQGQANACKRRMIGAFFIGLSIIFKISPMISVGSACQSVFDEICTHCASDTPCVPEETQEHIAGCTVIFSFGVYMYPLTLAMIFLSGCLMVLGFTYCCVCNCCCGKLSEDPKAAEPQVVGPVIGAQVVEAKVASTQA